MTDDVTGTAPEAPEPTAPTQSLNAATEAWVSAPVEAAPEPIRNPDGTFAAATPSDPPPADAAPAPDTPAPPADDPDLYIEARQGDEVVKLRKDVLVPLVRHGQVEWKPLEKVRAEGMLKADYDAKMQERRAAEMRLAEREAELNYRAQRFEAEEKRLYEAMHDPEKRDQYEQHLEMYRSNELYREMVDRATRGVEIEAREIAVQSVHEQSVIQDAVQTATAWIADTAARYPGVDPERVLARYSQALQDPRNPARFHPDEVDAIARDEAARLAPALTPLQDKVAKMEAELAALKAANGAARTNDTTAHALRRAQTIPTTPVGGTPPVPGQQPLVGANGRKDLGSLTDAWVKRR